MPLADAVRRRWTMNDEYQTYMYEHEVAASVFDFLGLDEWGEIFIRRVKRAIGHADTAESWDRANYLANHWESIQRSVDKSLRLPRRKARQRTELDRRKDINAIRQVFRESDYLIPNSQRGLKTLDDTNMPPDVQRIRQVGQELIRRFLRDVAKASEAKLATFKFEEVVYEASALQKLTVVILKAELSPEQVSTSALRWRMSRVPANTLSLYRLPLPVPTSALMARQSAKKSAHG